MNGNRNNNHHDQDDDTNDQAQSHFHIFPPHFLSDSVGALSETLGADGKRIGLVFDRIQPVTSLCHFIYVVPHDVDSVVNLLHGDS